MKHLIALVGILLILGCRDLKDCQLDPNQDYLIVQFLDADSVLKQVSFQYVITEESPYNYSDSTRQVTNLFLPLNPADTLVTYLFITDSMDFTTTFTYEPRGYFYEVDCDALVRYLELEVENFTGFDSVKVIGGHLNKYNPLNVQIYF